MAAEQSRSRGHPELDGLKIPFVARQEDVPGRSATVVRVKEVKHNVAIDECNSLNGRTVLRSLTKVERSEIG